MTIRCVHTRKGARVRPAAGRREPQEPPPAVGAGSALAVIGTSATNAVVWLIIFVVVDSRTIFVPVVLYLFGGERATTQLDSAKGWLGAQRCRDDGAVPGLGCGPHRRRRLLLS
jgi:hypothetical protein